MILVRMSTSDFIDWYFSDPVLTQEPLIFYCLVTARSILLFVLILAADWLCRLIHQVLQSILGIYKDRVTRFWIFGFVRVLCFILNKASQCYYFSSLMKMAIRDWPHQ
jgi:hypothetical protein